MEYISANVPKSTYDFYMTLNKGQLLTMVCYFMEWNFLNLTPAQIVDIRRLGKKNKKALVNYVVELKCDYYERKAKEELKKELELDNEN